MPAEVTRDNRVIWAPVRQAHMAQVMNALQFEFEAGSGEEQWGMVNARARTQPAPSPMALSTPPHALAGGRMGRMHLAAHPWQAPRALDRRRRAG